MTDPVKGKTTDQVLNKYGSLYEVLCHSYFAPEKGPALLSLMTNFMVKTSHLHTLNIGHRGVV